MSNFGKKLTIAAPAKLNLHLAVKDRRPDGFHNLESLFLALAFGDTLHFELPAETNTLEINMEAENGQAGSDIPLEKNLIFKAVSLFRGKTGYDQGIRITVEKRIPPGSGMGGGSSDAASTLLALNRLAAESAPAGFPLSREALLQTAASLGSDVPFFVSQTGAAWVSGRGESVSPVKTPRCFFVLVNPGFSSDTAAAYRLLDEYRACSTETPDAVTGQPLLDALAGSPKSWPFKNDFLPVFQDGEKSVYIEIISQLKQLGAGFSGLSGTGSTCFGVFTEEAQAVKAADALSKSWNWVQLAQPVNL